VFDFFEQFNQLTHGQWGQASQCLVTHAGIEIHRDQMKDFFNFNLGFHLRLEFLHCFAFNDRIKRQEVFDEQDWNGQTSTFANPFENRHSSSLNG